MAEDNGLRALDPGVVAAVLEAYRPDGVVLWLAAWLNADEAQRARMNVIRNAEAWSGITPTVEEVRAELAAAGHASPAAADEPARRLLEEGLHLTQYGERAPGGNETWPDWSRKVEAYLRAASPAAGPATDEADDVLADVGVYDRVRDLIRGFIVRAVGHDAGEAMTDQADDLAQELRMEALLRAAGPATPDHRDDELRARVQRLLDVHQSNEAGRCAECGYVRSPCDVADVLEDILAAGSGR